MDKLKTRSEINELDKWDLTTIYKLDEDFYSDCDRLSKLIDEFIDIKDTMMNSGTDLYKVLKKDDEIMILSYKLYMYAHLNKDSETTNTVYQTMYGKIQNISNKYDEMASFMIPTLLKSDYSVIEKFYEEEPKLLEYEFTLKDIFREKPHVLSEKEERVLSSLQQTLGFAENVYDVFSNAELKFDEIKDEEGNLIELTDSNYSIYLKSQDRRVREDAFKTIYKGYSNFKNTISLMLANHVKTCNTTSKLRNFKSSLEKALFADNIDEKVYNNLVNTVESNIEPLNEYLRLKKEILKVEDLHLYDLYVPLIKETNNKKYSFEEAKELVINAVSVLGDDYINIINKAFDERWIDKYPNEAKVSGAYSSGSYTTNPFVLLNFQGQLGDVSTLAHELGHSLHSYYSRKNNPYQYSHYTIFVAEVASTVNELLLSHYLLKNSKNNEEKLMILNRLIELYRTTVYRQTMFSSFEKKIYDLDFNGEVLTSDLMNEVYYELNKKYFGDVAVVDEEIKYEWQRVPHFYYNFYVYKYATGLSAASAIVNKILNGEENAVENYLEFLKTGGRDYPIEELKVAGVDMTDKFVIENSLKAFDDTVKQFKKIYYETYK